MRLGRLVEKRTNLAASGTIRTGYNYGPGIYHAVIGQGVHLKSGIRLIKKLGFRLRYAAVGRVAHLISSES